jgi:sugar lactone lactonase YvrE
VVKKYITTSSSSLSSHHHSNSELLFHQHHILFLQNLKMQFLAPLSALVASTLAANLTTVFQYPPGTWLENIAHMRNGSLLVTLIGSPEVRIVDPTVSPATSSLVTKFPNANSVLGITEVKTDVFAVVVGTLNTSNNTPLPGSFSIWTLDLGCSETGTSVQKVVDTPKIGLANGLTTLSDHVVLVADAYNGNVVRVDIKQKTYAVVLQDKSLAPDFSGKASLPFGVNGVRFHASTSTLYYTNTVQNLIGHVKINRSSGRARGKFEVIAQGAQVSQPDDLAVLNDGSVVLARPVADTIQHIGLDGRVRELAKGGLASGATSVVVVKEGEVYLSESGLVGGVSGGGGRVAKLTF